MARTILHIDFDSFFASVEQQHTPSLRGIPLGVTATNGRSCIIAASREAKKYGIATGSRTFDAYKVCPQLEVVPADFVKYWEVSKKFIAICKDFSPLLEVFSIDELFIDITPSQHLFGGTYQTIRKLKKRIQEEIGEYITVSIGISHNKMLAKMASGLRKPNGVVEINSANIWDIYEKAELTDICGIGYRVKARLNKLGIYTLMDLKTTSLQTLLEEFGDVEGHFLKNVGNGIDETPVVPYTISPDVKSVGRNYCLPHNEYDKRVVLQNMYELCEEVGIKLRRLEKKSRRVGLFVRGNVNLHGEHTYNQYFWQGHDMFKACLFFLGKNFMNHSYDYVRQIGVWASHLEDEKNVPHTLFDNEGKKDILTRVVDGINDKYGDHTIRNAFLLYADKLTTVPNGYGSDRWERKKLAIDPLM